MSRRILNRRTLLSATALTGLSVLGINEWSCGGIFGPVHSISARNVDDIAHTLHLEIYCSRLGREVKESEQTVELPADSSLYSVAKITGKKRLVATTETGTEASLTTTSDIEGATIGIRGNGNIAIGIPA